MKTIYVKRNFPVILTTVAFIISFIYLIDHYYYCKDIDKIPDSEQMLIENNDQFISNSSVMFIKSKEPSSTETDNAIQIIRNKCSVTAALILCEDNQYLSIKKGNDSKSLPPLAKDFTRQINQTIVMLKSIAIQTLYDPGIDIEQRGSNKNVDCVNVIILSDRKVHFNTIRDKIQSEWSQEFQATLNLTFVPVQYPQGSGWMKKMFRPCATLRLFIPELLPKEYDESIIYLDTDFIFLRSLQSLQRKYFEQEVKGQGKKPLAGMAPCLFHYGTKINRVPYYGSSGLNAGLMIMNLKRMRESLWTNKIRMVTAMFQHEIKLADQDILNIYFHFFPEELTPLTCDWNFRPFQCREGNYCDDPSLASGISALHGNALSFTPQGPEPLFFTVFNAFHQLKLDEHFNLETFVENLETKLLKAEENLHSDCVRYGGFSVMVLNRLDKLVRITDTEEGSTDSFDSGGGNNISEDFEYHDYSFYN